VDNVEDWDATGQPILKSPTRARDATREWEFDANATYNEVVFSEAWKQHRPAAYHQYRRDWVEIPRDKRETPFPLHLDIETTTRCNLKCPMCSRTQMVEAGEFDEWAFISREDYARIIDEATANGVRSIKLNYLGEPLLHKDVVWQVAYAKEKGVIDVLMNTNATALTQRNARALLEAGVDGVFISFDAANPRDYEQQRVGTSMGRVLDNVYTFVKLRNQIRPGCQVRVSMVMYDDPKWREQFQAMRVIWKNIVDAIGYAYFVEHDPKRLLEHPKVDGFHCAQPFHRMFLKANGNVTICCFDERDQTPMGNWKTQSLSEIWNGELYRSVRGLHASGRYHEMKLCRRCYFPVSYKQPGR